MGKPKRRNLAPTHGSTVSSTVSSRLPSTVPSTVSSRAPTPPPSKEQDGDSDSDVASSKKRPRQPFRFFDLPSELRLRIYEEVFHVQSPLDLDPLNYRSLHWRMALFLVSRRMHQEAYPVFYSQPIRLYPYHGRFFHTKKPLLARLSARYRQAVTTLELRLGPGWSAPPRCQNTASSLGLADCTALRTLRILIEIDPSDSVFSGFRGKGGTEETYKLFCLGLLRGIVEQVPGLRTVVIDAYPAVNRHAPLVMALVRTVEEEGKALVWGPLRGWDKEVDEKNGIISGLEGAMGALGIADVGGRVVSVEA